MGKEKSDEVEAKDERSCVSCDYGHFTGDMPVSGECRKMPPRSYLEQRDGKPGRFFPMVRFDDWCGQYRPSRDLAGVNGNMHKLARFQAPERQREIAGGLTKAGKFSEAVALLEAIFPVMDAGQQDVAFDLACLYHKFAQPESGVVDQEAMKKVFYWHRIASEMGHAESTFRVAMCYERGDGVDVDPVKAAELMQKAADLGSKRAQKRLAPEA